MYWKNNQFRSMNVLLEEERCLFLHLRLEELRYSLQDCSFFHFESNWPQFGLVYGLIFCGEFNCY